MSPYTPYFLAVYVLYTIYRTYRIKRCSKAEHENRWLRQQILLKDIEIERLKNVA